MSGIVSSSTWRPYENIKEIDPLAAARLRRAAATMWKKVHKLSQLKIKRL
jgi:hypothetical protein